MQALDNLKVIIEVKGNSRHTVGDVIEFDLTVSEDQKPSSNKYYSGNYLITAIHHQITDAEYSQTMEIVKESYPTRMATEGEGA